MRNYKTIIFCFLSGFIYLRRRLYWMHLTPSNNMKVFVNFLVITYNLPKQTKRKWKREWKTHFCKEPSKWKREKNDQSAETSYYREKERPIKTIIFFYIYNIVQQVIREFVDWFPGHKCLFSNLIFWDTKKKEYQWKEQNKTRTKQFW